MPRKVRRKKSPIKPRSAQKKSQRPVEPAVDHGKELLHALRRLIRTSGSFEAQGKALPGQPFDSLLLSRSRLYQRSRRLFARAGGRFVPALLSSPRSLSSVELVGPIIQYSPIENELVWGATDSVQSRETANLLSLRTYTTSVYHEQNHRILWKLLPPPPIQKSALERYLNLAESLVVIADMALGDELGAKLAQDLYLCGSIYNPGTDIRREGLSKRDYRNYLQGALSATWLALQFYPAKDVREILAVQFPFGQELVLRAADRALRLDRQFIEVTNYLWQEKHHRKVAEALRAGRSEEELLLSADPTDSRVLYLWGERWMDLLGI